MEDWREFSTPKSNNCLAIFARGQPGLMHRKMVCRLSAVKSDVRVSARAQTSQVGKLHCSVWQPVVNKHIESTKPNPTPLSSPFLLRFNPTIDRLTVLSDLPQQDRRSETNWPSATPRHLTHSHTRLGPHRRHCHGEFAVTN